TGTSVSSRSPVARNQSSIPRTERICSAFVSSPLIVDIAILFPLSVHSAAVRKSSQVLLCSALGCQLHNGRFDNLSCFHEFQDVCIFGANHRRNLPRSGSKSCSRTNAPPFDPTLISTSPDDSSERKASRTEIRLTPNCSARPRSGGSRSPARQRPEKIAS